MQARRVTWGGLRTIVVDSDQPPTAAVIFCHGFGASGTDLVGLAPALAEMQPELARQVLWIFPEAPLSLAEQGMPGGRAWWPLDMEELMAAINQGRMRDLRGQTPPELPAAREHLLQLLADLEREHQLPLDRVILGGFSQGSMLATDTALYLPAAPAGLCVLSGTLLSEQIWSVAVARRRLNVFQSHGHFDQILPYENAVALRELLTASGSDVEFVEFKGGHEIPPPVLTKLATWLVARLPRE